MNYDSIFDQPEEKIEWFSFKNVNDRVSGTYIDLEEDIDGFKNPQLVVSLLRDGIKIKIGFRKTHTWIIDQITKLRLGQVVGFVFKEALPNTKGNPTKVIVLKQSPNLIDTEWTQNWLRHQQAGGIPVDVALRPSILTGISALAARIEYPTLPFETTAPAVATPVQPSVPEVASVSSQVVPNPVFDTIRNLATSKGLVAAGTPAEAIDAVIMATTGLEINEANTTQIIVALSSIQVK